MLGLLFFSLGIFIWNLFSIMQEETSYYNDIKKIEDDYHRDMQKINDDYYRDMQRIDDEYYRDLERMDKEDEMREKIYELQNKLSLSEQKNYDLEQRLEKKYATKVKQTKKTCWNGNTWQEIKTEVKTR